jgi:hypothetical protein
MNKMKLKKGYTQAELNDFMQQVFRERKKVRQSPSGDWEVYASNDTDDASDAKDDASTKKRSVWKRFKSLFKGETN